jgi:ATP-dependent protease ClpP protease subunit
MFAKKQKAMEDPIEKLKALMPTDLSEKENNHIYFYTDVNPESCLDLNRKITALNKELLKYAIDYDCEPPNIYLHINSYGGCLFSALSVVDTIKNSRVPIVSIVEGNAASAATMISMVCNKRYITPNSFMLIHQLSSACSGNFEALKDEFLSDTKLMELIYKLYRENTTMSEKEIKTVLKRDIWWTSAECIKAGLVDGLWDSNITSMKIKNLFRNECYNTEKETEKKPQNPSKKRKMK